MKRNGWGGKDWKDMTFDERVIIQERAKNAKGYVAADYALFSKKRAQKKAQNARTAKRIHRIRVKKIMEMRGITDKKES